jgi:hypothetical protein
MTPPPRNAVTPIAVAAVGRREHRQRGFWRSRNCNLAHGIYFHHTALQYPLQPTMPRTKKTSRKRKSSEYASDNGFSENASEGSERPTKRTKPTTSTFESARLQPQTDSDGSTFWEISKMRRVTLSEFKGKQMVSVREYYEQNGEMKPGKKV